MDKIYIEDLAVFAYHGALEEENSLGQRFYISMEIGLDLKECAKEDDLTKTEHYGFICMDVEKLFKEKKYKLIETCAEEIAELILKKYERVETIKVKVRKPSAPIPCILNSVAVEIERSWHTAYIGMGSNMGDRKTNLDSAVEYLNNNSNIKVTNKSSIIETEPWGYTDQESFLNAVVEVKTLLTPLELMEILLDIEKKLKRERIIKWGPRTIDLDILLFDNIVTQDPRIIVPHPRMHERLFVIQPLYEIAPYALHPLLNKRIYEIKEELDK